MSGSDPAFPSEKEVLSFVEKLHLCGFVMTNRERIAAMARKETH